MEPDREERLRRRARWRNISAVVGGVLGVLSHLSHLSHRSELLPFFLPLAVVAIGFSVVSFVQDRRTKRRISDGHEGERWPLGEPYHVAFEFPRAGNRRAGELHVGEDDLTILVNFAQAVAIEFADVRSVRVRRSTIDVETPRETLSLVPSSYADRQRLLWELAVRCPDAMERAMDEDAARAKTSAAPPPRAPAPAENADRPPSGLALGSALAGPAERGNPAPPRKSGLGVGLFVPPPGSKSEPPM